MLPKCCCLHVHTYTIYRDLLYLCVLFLHVLCILLYTGAGKTSTFSMLTGELSPSGGTAVIAGYDIRTDIRKVICSVYIVVDVVYTL